MPGSCQKADSDPAGLGWSLRLCIANRLPGGADVNGLWPCAEFESSRRYRSGVEAMWTLMSCGTLKFCSKCYLKKKFEKKKFFSSSKHSKRFFSLSASTVSFNSTDSRFISVTYFGHVFFLFPLNIEAWLAHNRHWAEEHREVLYNHITQSHQGGLVCPWAVTTPRSHSSGQSFSQTQTSWLQVGAFSLNSHCHPDGTKSLKLSYSLATGTSCGRLCGPKLLSLAGLRLLRPSFLCPPPQEPRKGRGVSAGRAACQPDLALISL